MKSDSINAIEIALFKHRISAVCAEMAAVLKQTSVSPNIRDRLDYSCAVFSSSGKLIEQESAIPVHLGSMAHALSGIIQAVNWCDGDQLIVNDPYAGGTHLPDVTLVAPVIVNGDRVGFVANRAHHADIGAEVPGSMPLATRLDQEGCIISPRMIRQQELDGLCAQFTNPQHSKADFMAQMNANSVAARRLTEQVSNIGQRAWHEHCEALFEYTRRLGRESIKAIEDGCYAFSDVMDSDGQGNSDIRIALEITIESDHMHLDFSGTADQVDGNINCPLSVTAAAAFYVLRCLAPSWTPTCGALLDCMSIRAPAASLVNAQYPAAVAAGNVETSMRLVDVICGALAKAIPDRIPAAGQGTMNNVAMGAGSAVRPWNFYETIAGGAGAGRNHDGASAIHTHMTNTLNTPIEIVENDYPLRVETYRLRPAAENVAARHGGRGLVRAIRFLELADVTLITERRRVSPWGIAGGADGRPGCNQLNEKEIPAKVHFCAQPGDVLQLTTPDGGGWGLVDESAGNGQI